MQNELSSSADSDVDALSAEPVASLVSQETRLYDTAPPPPEQPTSFLRVSRRINIAIVMLVFMSGVAVAYASTKQEVQNSNSPASRFGTVELPLDQLNLDTEAAAEATVAVNGQLKLNNGLIVSPSVQPAGPVAGQLYYDRQTNQFKYYDGSRFVTVSNDEALAAVRAQLQAAQAQLDGLQNAVGRIQPLNDLSDFASLTGANTFTAFNNFSGGLSAASLALSSPLGVGSGGTGAASHTLNGLLIGQGSGPLSTVTAGGAGLCLISTAGAPGFQACPGSGSLSGSGVAGQLAFFTGATAVASDSNLFWDDTNNRLGIGTAAPTDPLHLNGALRFVNAIEGALDGNVKIFTGVQPTAAAQGTFTPGMLGNIASYGDSGNGLVFQYGGATDAGGMKLTDDGLMVWGAGDDNLFTLIDEDYNREIMAVDNDGAVTFRSSNNSTAGFLIQDSDANSIFNVDTVNGRVGIGTAAPGNKLEIVHTNNYEGITLKNNGFTTKSNTLTFADSVGEVITLGTDRFADGTADFFIDDGASGINRLYVAPNGRIGIGDVTNPQYLLDADGDINSWTGYRIAGTAGASVTCTGGQLLQNVVVVGGIGTAGSCVAPDGGVTVVGVLDSQTKSANGAVIVGTSIYMQTADATNPGLVSTGTQTFAGSKTFTGNNMLFKPGANSTTAFQIQPAAAATPIFNVDTTNSRIGLGTAAPAAELHISKAGDAEMILEADTGDADETANPLITLRQDGGGTSVRLGITDNTAGSKYTDSLTNAGYIGSFAAGDPFQLVTNGAAAMTLLANGNVGIGTNAPGSILQVNGDVGNGVNQGVLIDLVLSGTDANKAALNVNPLVWPDAASTNAYFAANFQPYSDSANLAGGAMGGLFGGTYFAGTGALANAYGAYIQNFKEGTGSINNAYGIYVDDPSLIGGTITNNAGMAILDQVAAANNVNLLLGTDAIPAGNFSIYNDSAYQNYFNGRLGIGTDNPDFKLEVAGSLFDSANNFNFVIGATDTTAAAQGVGGGIGFIGEADTDRTFAAIQGFHESSTASNYNGGLRFFTRTNGQGNLNEQARIGSNGATLFKNSADSTTAFRVQNAAGTATVLTVDTANNRVVLANLEVTGHLISSGSAPSIAAGAAACTTPTVGVSGTDVAGMITVTTGTGCAATGTLATITFANAFGAAPRVALTPADANAAGLAYYYDATTITTASFQLRTGTVPADSTTYRYSYQIIQ